VVVTTEILASDSSSAPHPMRMVTATTVRMDGMTLSFELKMRIVIIQMRIIII
jgi:hypothetical protein